MSTEIKGACVVGSGSPRRSFRLGMLDGYEDDPRMFIQALSEGGREVALINPSRADFLAAVAAECDVLIIPDSDGMAPDPEALAARNDPVAVRSHQMLARYHAKAAAWYDAHPPVDEAQVEALANLFGWSKGDGWHDTSATELARRLLATGRIEVKP